MNMKDWAVAIQCFEQVLQISASNKAAQNQIRLAKAKMREDEERDKKLYKNMFAKFAQVDTQVSVSMLSLIASLQQSLCLYLIYALTALFTELPPKDLHL